MIFTSPNYFIKQFKKLYYSNSEDELVEPFEPSGSGIGSLIFYICVFFLLPIYLLITRRQRLSTAVIVMSFLGLFWILPFSPLLSIILILSLSDLYYIPPPQIYPPQIYNNPY